MGGVLEEKEHLDRRAVAKREADQRDRGRSSVEVRIGGKEYRIRSDADPEWLQTVASYVDDAMQLIRDRTGTVDSQDIAVLTALNLAREVLKLRGDPVRAGSGDVDLIDTGRLRELIDLAEAELHASGASTGGDAGKAR
jgi:cell division protein ZapA